MEYHVPQLADVCPAPRGVSPVDDPTIPARGTRHVAIHPVLRGLPAHHTVRLRTQPAGAAGDHPQWLQATGDWSHQGQVPMPSTGRTGTISSKSSIQL